MPLVVFTVVIYLSHKFIRGPARRCLHFEGFILRENINDLGANDKMRYDYTLASLSDLENNEELLQI